MRLSALAKMPEPERKAALGAILEKAMAKPNGGLDDIERRIGEFELRYEIPSERLLLELEAGTRDETEEIATWLMLLSVRDRVG